MVEALEVRNLLTSTVLDFEELARTTTYEIGPYTHDGYALTTDAYVAGFRDTVFRIAGTSDTTYYAGSTSLSSQWAPTIIRLSRPDGEAFSIDSIDLSKNLDTSVPATRSLTFTGNKADGSTVSQNFTVDTFGFKTYAFPPSFNDLKELDWNFTGFDDYHQFDNIRLETAEPANAPPVAVNDSFTVAEDSVLNVIANGGSSLTMVSDPGDWVGAGRTYNLSEATGNFTENFYSNPNTVSIYYVNPMNSSDYWDLDFDAAGNNRLTTGTYLQATRYPFNGSGPGLSVTGQHRGCNTVTGQFTVNQIGFDAAGNLQTFDADFIQHCEGGTPALTGNVHFGPEASGVVGSVLANDTDADGDRLTVVPVSGPSHGTLDLHEDGTFVYTPAANFFGTDSFTYAASDGTHLSAPATVSIQVTPQPDPPVIDNQIFAVDENAPVGTVVGTLTGSDPDGDKLRYAILGGVNGPGPDVGTFSIDPDSGVVTVADPSRLDFERAQQITLVVSATDPSGLTDLATMTIQLRDLVDTVDVVPGDPTNTIDLHSKEFAVAILSTAWFNAPAQVNVQSLAFGKTGSESSLATHGRRGVRYETVDLNGDGRLDLVAYFDARDTDLAIGDTEAVLTGQLTDGTSFSYTADVNVVRRRGKPA